MKTVLALRLTRRPRAVAAGVPPGTGYAALSAAACPSRRTRIPRRLLALVAAVVTVAGLVTAVSTSPASAAGTDEICLTNSDGNCFWEDVVAGMAGVVILDIAGLIAEWIRDKVGQDNNGDPEDEVKDESTGLCLADTGLRPGAQAVEASCGANGTVWIWVKDTDGYYLYSRYSVDNGDSMVLTVDPLSNYAPVYLDIAGPNNHALWQQFTYY
jgi:hypothetical protein